MSKEKIEWLDWLIKLSLYKLVDDKKKESNPIHKNESIINLLKEFADLVKQMITNEDAVWKIMKDCISLNVYDKKDSNEVEINQNRIKN